MSDVDGWDLVTSSARAIREREAVISDATRIPVHHPRTASRVFSGEAVVISPAENMVRMFNPVGSRIWELADGTRTLEQIVGALIAEYEIDAVHARRSVETFVAELTDKGLLSWA
jgi:hypothetical protein